MNNTPPDKPGLYWATANGVLHLVKVEGQAPFLRASAVNVDKFMYNPFPIRADGSGGLRHWQWLGEANAPYSPLEEGA